MSTSAQATCPTFHTLTNGTAADASQVMDNFNSILQCPNFTGNVGIGMTPVNILDITQMQNAISIAQINNASAGAAAQAFVIARNGTHSAAIGMFGTGFAPSGLARADGAALSSNGLGGTAGNLGIGTTSPSYLLHVNGTAYATGAAGALSDIRRKEDIVTLNDGANGFVA